MKKRAMPAGRRGFTLIELIVTMTIGVIIISFAAFSLLGFQHTTSMTTTVDKLSTDIRSQQLQAMNGVAGNGGNRTPMGIYFAPGSYTLFTGVGYDPSGTSNFVVNLDSDLEFPAGNPVLLFAPGSGELTAPVDVILKDKTGGEIKTFKLNKLGNITEID